MATATVVPRLARGIPAHGSLQGPLQPRHLPASRDCAFGPRATADLHFLGKSVTAIASLCSSSPASPGRKPYATRIEK